jgi:hypothetical protein
LISLDELVHNCSLRVALDHATIEHSRSLATLRASGAPPRRSLSLIIAVLVALLGVGGWSWRSSGAETRTA